MMASFCLSFSFSVMAEASVGAAHVRLHAVIDMRPQPQLPSTFLRASGVTLTQTAGGTPATPFGETAEESGEGDATTTSADSSGSTSTTEGSESTTTEASETTEAGN